jgi:uncharacterized protein YbjT (DUF2867 family)
MKTALVFGSTGFIGSQLVRGLLDSPDYARVIAVARRPPALSDPQLSVLIGDLDTLPQLAPQLVADEIFIALGTTRRLTPDQAAYYRIDHDYPVTAAAIARQNGARAVFVVTAVGADATSGVFYVRTKGEVERDIIALDFDETHIFRPSMIMGERTERRQVERLIIAAWRIVDPLLRGPIDRYHGISAGEIAQAMIEAARSGATKLRIYHWREMMTLLPGRRRPDQEASRP